MLYPVNRITHRYGTICLVSGLLLTVLAGLSLAAQVHYSDPPEETAAVSPVETGRQFKSRSVRPTSASERLKDHFPNILLRTHHNKPVRFYDDLVKGKIVLINFMYTTCTGV